MGGGKRKQGAASRTVWRLHAAGGSTPLIASGVRSGLGSEGRRFEKGQVWGATAWKGQTAARRAPGACRRAGGAAARGVGRPACRARRDGAPPSTASAAAPTAGTPPEACSGQRENSGIHVAHTHTGQKRTHAGSERGGG
eukprot:4000656-Prymnesium_polylepis.1